MHIFHVYRSEWSLCRRSRWCAEPRPSFAWWRHEDEETLSAGGQASRQSSRMCRRCVGGHDRSACREDFSAHHTCSAAVADVQKYRHRPVCLPFTPLSPTAPSPAFRHDRPNRLHQTTSILDYVFRRHWIWAFCRPYYPLLFMTVASVLQMHTAPSSYLLTHLNFVYQPWIGWNKNVLETTLSHYRQREIARWPVSRPLFSWDDSTQFAAVVYDDKVKQRGAPWRRR